jgi:hypothetical protein
VFELKRLTPAGVAAALDKAEQYRLLNQPWAAESICWDIAAVDPSHQGALRTRLLAETDQLAVDAGAVRRARETLAKLTGAYDREYYAGLIAERRALAELNHRGPGSRFSAYDGLREAMECYERAEAIRPAGDDDAILRWNTCARLLNQSPHLVPRGDEIAEPVIGE